MFVNKVITQKGGKRDRPKECYKIQIMFIGAFELKGNFTNSTVRNTEEPGDINIFKNFTLSVLALRDYLLFLKFKYTCQFHLSS